MKKKVDIRIICKDCGKPFIFTAGEQNFYSKMGFKPPKRCECCRKNPLPKEFNHLTSSWFENSQMFGIGLCVNR